jgi:hypothetical protein
MSEDNKTPWEQEERLKSLDRKLKGSAERIRRYGAELYKIDLSMKKEAELMKKIHEEQQAIKKVL